MRAIRFLEGAATQAAQTEDKKIYLTRSMLAMCPARLYPAGIPTNIAKIRLMALKRIQVVKSKGRTCCLLSMVFEEKEVMLRKRGHAKGRASSSLRMHSVCPGTCPRDVRDKS